MKKYWRLLFIAFIGIFFLAACGKGDSEKKTAKLREEPYYQEKFLMGTYVRIRVYDEGKEDAMKPAFDRVKELADKITINQKGSEIDAINENAGIKPVKVTSDMYYLLKEAYKYSEETDEAFNMTIGAITQLWRIGFDDARKPAQSEIDAALKKIDFHKVKFNDQNQTVYLEEKGMIIDLGAIAKGYITDEVVKVLQDKGVTSAIVDLGGNVYVLGHSNRGQKDPWNVGIQDPNKSRGSIVGSIKEKNRTIVTSGIYERFLEVDGKKYHHIFDSKTGYPYDNDIAGVSIITNKSIDGDALSTSVFAMGVKEGLKFIEEHEKGSDAIFVTKDDKIYVTDGIKDNFKIGKDSGYTMGNRSELK
ncbi:FAD:protein FMN transferase [Enterococcus montenegrensis]|uniref:FAD:protein FMN transferase n=1 Tax=Enterococcus montenegrensis TaxID=3031993 RepID=UPI00249E91DA|nr:FAD:protein FMN transferase [Enterococcus montenegrensis]WHA09351.1 FAD:protein FMN transferase [Enterococcus montenegrensis]